MAGLSCALVGRGAPEPLAEWLRNALLGAAIEGAGIGAGAGDQIITVIVITTTGLALAVGETCGNSLKLV